ncbi:hypothetical protein KEU06_09210 [Pseudaminobacter sp. 19-2017]|uniref:Uncharacterized protein n=1 Tax=Pseudaminobacter soli (ex Zhang et al. 2022) TaxID=2831468 RepID=A0A942I1Z2_9HYPH|nr:hypothetical protein [Pseudaminobacter soli]MBS3648782.1 hypothetical protein [Pseudaminobacter soli]
MASVNVSEAEFMVVAHAAYEAHAHGDTDSAKVLDKLARKINAALSNETTSRATPFARVTKPASWKDMPSTLDREG